MYDGIEVQAAIIEWRARIRPAIDRAVVDANRKAAKANIALDVKDATGQYLDAPTGKTAELPGADVIAGPRPRHFLGRIAGSTPKTALHPAFINFSVREDGQVQIKAYNCAVAGIDPIPRRELTDEKIKKVISELIEKSKIA